SISYRLAALSRFLMFLRKRTKGCNRDVIVAKDSGQLLWNFEIGLFEDIYIIQVLSADNWFK
ncbi:MAG TPA: hypothetical protein VN374_06565, partial [Desulfitobacteriaceae bacterium]|nr:hypothetical protein [Desulfitobacteriaceae bacterium]